MDLTALGVTEIEGCRVGDEVVAIGRQGSEQITAGEAAQAAGTIAYEMLTGVSVRVPRFYSR